MKIEARCLDVVRGKNLRMVVWVGTREVDQLVTRARSAAGDVDLGAFQLMIQVQTMRFPAQ